MQSLGAIMSSSSSSSRENSPAACSPTAPESVACYEECITDDTGYDVTTISSAASSPDGFSSNFTATTSGTDHEEEASVMPVMGSSGGSRGIPKSNSSGRVTKRGRSRPKSLKNRKCSSPLILQWLGENYEMVAGSCLPRSVLYTHYQDFCKKNQLEASSAASFGKIIRLKFPDLSTRRLGTRGQSKYHYYGLAIKETSIYYRSVYSKKGLTRFSGAANKRENGQTYNPSSKTGILLPNFPKTSELNFSSPFPVEKVETFLIMYKAHCQRILDSVVRANFQEVQDFLVHFWQGMPTHMLPILSCQATVDLVVICDFLLYRTLCEVLIPASLQSLPENLIEEIMMFSHNIVEWVFNALQDLPAALGIRKVQTCEMFGKSLRRQTALVQLAKSVRGVLRNSDEVTALLQDLRTVDVEAMILQPEACGANVDLFREMAHELEQLFIKQSSLEVYFEWLDSIVEKHVSEPGERGLSLVQLSHEFLSSWSTFYSLMERQFSSSSSSAKSLEHYIALHKLMDEYIHYVLELLQARAIESQYNEALKIPSSAQVSPGSMLPPPPLPHHYHPDLYSAAIAAGDEHDPRLLFPPTPDQTPLPGSAASSSLADPNSLFPATSIHPHHHHHHHHQAQLGSSGECVTPDLSLPLPPPLHPGHPGNINYFPGDLHSPFVPGAPDGLCDGLIKSEFQFKCGGSNVGGCGGMMMGAMPHDSPMTPFPLESTPLTPQSSQYSGSSPLSHISMSVSPEPPPYFTTSSSSSSLSSSSATSGSDNAAEHLPLSSPLLHGHGTTSSALSVATTPTSLTMTPPAVDIYHSQLGTEVVLAQGHSGGFVATSVAAAANDLDIVRSLELITGANNNGRTATVSPPLPESYNTAGHPSVSPPPQPGAILQQQTSSSSSLASSCSASPDHVSATSFDQYEFELLQLMSNPDDLLADPKILLHSSAPTPIH